ncbi:DNA adenine methylase [Elizabethkingia anophelis]|uniref:DNA adenine methylase n=1 Tax=Elizabethkingia anophelis TaxID=1117645 RepID=UPI00293C13B8|nr:DNA methyltransferase [Elizabethkingia anophelis]
MITEEKIEKETIIKPNSFRTIHYLGSKLRVLDFIKQVVDELDPERNGICDLFAGTGSVSQYFSKERKVVSVDIQNYSNIICSALLFPNSNEFIYSFPEKLNNSDFLNEYLKIFEPLILIEESIINGDLSSNLETVCHFLENASLYSYLLNEQGDNLLPELKIAFKATEENLKSFNNDSFIATKYFGGVYFSYKQSVILDVIISEIEKTDIKYKNILIASLLSTASDIVNTVGKQFAQPIRPRNKNGQPKKGLLKQLRKDRTIDVLTLYKSWLYRYLDNDATEHNHQILHLDYREALKNLDDSVRVVYADPPYTRDHYSRFYHGLETLSLRDYPSISKTKIGGKEKLSRGLYREEREQSDFCIRSKAPKAFEELFKLVAEKNRVLILSYSPYDKSKGAHPRVVEIELLEELAGHYFDNVEIRSIGKFSHSKLNRTDLHLDAGNAAEILIICSNN